MPEAAKKVDEAINGCKRLISNRLTEKVKVFFYESRIWFYVMIGFAAALLFGFGYYIFQRKRLSKKLNLYLNELNEPEKEPKYRETRVSIG